MSETKDEAASMSAQPASERCECGDHEHLVSPIEQATEVCANAMGDPDPDRKKRCIMCGCIVYRPASHETATYWADRLEAVLAQSEVK